MSWQAYFPTRVFFGRGVVNDQAELLHTLGSRALIVTGAVRPFVMKPLKTFAGRLRKYRLSKKNNIISSLFSQEAMAILGKELRIIAQKKLTAETRESLLYASYLAGIAISLTGTSIPHAIGYSRFPPPADGRVFY